MTTRVEKHRILLVDDEPDISMLLTFLLEDAGFQVEAESDGQRAVELAGRKLQAEEFHVALLDVTMPGLDGIQVAAALRGCPCCRHLRIAFYTATTEDWVRKRFTQYDDFMTKPLPGHQLVQRVARLCAR